MMITFQVAGIRQTADHEGFMLSGDLKAQGIEARLTSDIKGNKVIFTVSPLNATARATRDVLDPKKNKDQAYVMGFVSALVDGRNVVLTLKYNEGNPLF